VTKPEPALLKRKTPVILVPGFFPFNGMQRWKKILEKNNHPVEIVEFSKFFPRQPIEEQAFILRNAVKDVLKKYSAERCHLMGFSMGAVVILYFLQKVNTDKVGKCVLAAAPFWGIRKYLLMFYPFFLIFKGLKQIVPGSDFVADIVNFGPAKDVEIYTLRGKNDLLCSEKSGRLFFANNLAPISSGHAGIYLALNKNAVDAVLKILED